LTWVLSASVCCLPNYPSYSESFEPRPSREQHPQYVPYWDLAGYNTYDLSITCNLHVLSWRHVDSSANQSQLISLHLSRHRDTVVIRLCLCLLMVKLLLGLCLSKKLGSGNLLYLLNRLYLLNLLDRLYLLNTMKWLNLLNLVLK
jgi:hypothetical protein